MYRDTSRNTSQGAGTLGPKCRGNVWGCSGGDNREREGELVTGKTGGYELQLPLLFTCDSHLLSVPVTCASSSRVFQLIAHIYPTGEPLVFAFCIAGSFVVVPNCSFTFRQAFLCLLICVEGKRKKKTSTSFVVCIAFMVSLSPFMLLTTRVD